MKHVQTELEEDEDEQFREFARERGLSLKEGGHEALVGWIERQRRPDPDDPAVTVLDESPEADPARETDAREEDDRVEEWHGGEDTLTLAEGPLKIRRT